MKQSIRKTKSRKTKEFRFLEFLISSRILRWHVSIFQLECWGSGKSGQWQYLLLAKRFCCKASGKNWNWLEARFYHQTVMRIMGIRWKFFFTRPKPAYGRQGLDWIVGPGYSFAVFSTVGQSDHFSWQTDRQTDRTLLSYIDNGNEWIEWSYLNWFVRDWQTNY